MKVWSGTENEEFLNQVLSRHDRGVNVVRLQLLYN